MKISNDEIKKALKIKNAIQHYLEMTKEVNIRSTDVFPYLVRKGIFGADKHNGLYFRRFLKRLYKANMLRSLIPQCTYVPGINGEIFGEWYFNVNSSKSLSENIECTDGKNDEPFVITIEEARKILFNLLEGRSPETGNLLDKEENPILFKISQSLKVFTEYDEGITENNSYQNNTENQLEIVSTSSSRKKTESTTNPTYSIDEIRESYPNAYKPWKREEENLLIELLNKNYKPNEIALKLKRQNSAIHSRMRKLGLKD